MTAHNAHPGQEALFTLPQQEVPTPLYTRGPLEPLVTPGSTYSSVAPEVVAEHIADTRGVSTYMAGQIAGVAMPEAVTAAPAARLARRRSGIGPQYGEERNVGLIPNAYGDYVTGPISPEQAIRNASHIAAIKQMLNNKKSSAV